MRHEMGNTEALGEMAEKKSGVRAAKTKSEKNLSAKKARFIQRETGYDYNNLAN